MRPLWLALVVLLAGCASPEPAPVDPPPERTTEAPTMVVTDASLQLVVGEDADDRRILKPPTGNSAGGTVFLICPDSWCSIGNWTWPDRNVSVDAGVTGTIYVDVAPPGRYDVVATILVNGTVVAHVEDSVLVANSYLLTGTGAAALPFVTSTAATGPIHLNLSLPGPNIGGPQYNEEWRASTGLELSRASWF